MKNQSFFSVVMTTFITFSSFQLVAQNSGTYNLQIEADAYVYEETASTNYGSSVDLIAGRGTEFGYINRTYLKFDQSPLPADAEVLSASLYIYMHSATSSSYRLQVRKVTVGWEESTLNWNNQPGAESTVYLSDENVTNESEWKVFDVTDAVQDWVEGQTNEGLVLKAYDETGIMENCVFFSRESDGCRPYIQVVYLTDETVPESPDAPVCSMSGDDTPPNVSIEFSANSVTLGNSVDVTATAWDFQGIYKVQLYRGSTFVGEATDDSYEHTVETVQTVTPASAGPVMFFAVAYNDRMQCTRIAEKLMVVVDGEPPVVTIYHEPEHPDVGESVTFYATAEDEAGISGLAIEVNGVAHILPVTPGALTANGSIDIEDAGICYNPASTRLVNYSALCYDNEGNHTTCGPHVVIFGESSGIDTDIDGVDDDIEEILGTDPENEDTDNDGLYDSWEIFGTDRNHDGTIEVDLPGMGASPHQPDMFIEIDWMEDATHSHKPHPWAIQELINVYKCYGINVHVDAGAMGGGNAVPHSLGDGISSSKVLIETVAPFHRDSSRLGIFRYALCGHVWSESYGVGMVVICTEPPGYTGSNDVDEPYMQANHLVHEFGHTLDLGHGGQDRSGTYETYSLDPDFNVIRNDKATRVNVNRKPNYLSLMNYLYEEQNGLRVLTSSGDVIFIHGFSLNQNLLNDLDENHLDESTGLNFPLQWGMYTWRRDVTELQLVHDWFSGTYYFLYRGVWILADGGPVNWDRDGVGSETDVPADINGDGSNSRLTSPDDVRNFVLQIKVEPTGVSWLNGNEGSKASEETVAPTDELCDGADNDFDGMIDEGFPDLDQDGVADFIDNALNAYNPLQVDINRNYIGDYAEVPLNKATTMSASFDKGKLVTYLAWYAAESGSCIVGIQRVS